MFWRIFTDFPFGIMISELLFAAFFERRKLFWLRALTALPVWVIYAWVAESGTPQAVPAIVENLSLCGVMAITVAWLFFCFRIGLNQALFCFIAAYAVQNMHHNMRVNIIILLEEATGVVFEPWMTALFSLALMLLLYGAAYLFLIRKFLRTADYSSVRRSRLIVYGAFMLLMSTFFVPNLPENYSLNRILYFGYYLVADALILFLLFGLLNEGAQAVQIATMDQLIHAEQRQHEISAETIDIINIKCHDLKKQIAAIRSGAEGTHDEAIREIEEAVQIYDSSVKTGNDSLDIILMEKLLYCEKYHIQLTCMADGGKLGFMSAADIFSLFGNALDNAIESVCKEEEEKRVISLRVACKDTLLKIRVENYFSGTVTLQNGLPVTSKADKKYHGFGMLSMRHVVTKYGGTMAIEPKPGLFVVNALIPIPQKKKTA